MEALTSYVKITQGIVPQSAASGAITGTVVTCTGFDRACHVIELGVIPSTGSINASVWESNASNGTFTLIAGTLSTISSAGGSESYAIEVPVATAKPYQKVLATAGTTQPIAGTCILFAGSGLYPKTQQNTAVVV